VQIQERFSPSAKGWSNAAVTKTIKREGGIGGTPFAEKKGIFCALNGAGADLRGKMVAGNFSQREMIKREERLRGKQGAGV